MQDIPQIEKIIAIFNSYCASFYNLSYIPNKLVK